MHAGGEMQSLSDKAKARLFSSWFVLGGEKQSFLGPVKPSEESAI